MLLRLLTTLYIFKVVILLLLFVDYVHNITAHCYVWMDYIVYVVPMSALLHYSTLNQFNWIQHSSSASITHDDDDFIAGV